MQPVTHIFRLSEDAISVSVTVMVASVWASSFPASYLLPCSLFDRLSMKFEAVLVAIAVSAAKPMAK